MAITVGTANRSDYYGLSTDVKPVLPFSAIGSTFLETDTGRGFIYSGTAWIAGGGILGGGTMVAGGLAATVAGGFTRPNDANAYGIGDTMADSVGAPTTILFSNCARIAAGSGIIIGAHLAGSANVIPMLYSELWLFLTAPTLTGDNVPFAPADVDLSSRLVGIITFAVGKVGNPGAGAAGNIAFTAELANYITFTCGAGSRSLEGVLVARNAYVPVAQETFTIKLRLLQD